MKAYTYNDRLVGVGNDQILGTDQGGGSTYTAGNGIDITNDVISVDDTVALASAIPDISGLATKAELQDGLELVTGLIPDTSDMATKTWVGNQGYLTSVPEGYATDQELAEAVTAVTSIIPAAQVNSDWNANSGVAEILNKPTEIQLIAGTNVQIEVSGVSAVISAQGGGGSSYTAGDFIDITNDVISVDDTSNVVAGDGINITQSGNNTTISLGVTAGITDIQLVNSLPASPTSTVLYLIPET